MTLLSLNNLALVGGLDSCVASTSFENTAVGGGGVLATGYQVLYGQEIGTSMGSVGDTINRLTFKLGKTGSPNCVLSARIYSGTVGNATKTLVSTSTTTYSGASLTTSQTNKTFDFASDRVLVAGDCLVCMITTNTSTDLSNRININYDHLGGTADSTDCTATVAAPTTFVLNSPAGYDMTMKAEKVCP